MAKRYRLARVALLALPGANSTPPHSLGVQGFGKG
jgi:hypothetical protein